MRVRNSVSGETFTARLTTGNSALSYGQPVLVVAGDALGLLDVIGLELVGATEHERDALEAAGYHLPEGRIHALDSR